MENTHRPLFRGQDPWAKTTDHTAGARGFALHTHLADVVGLADTVVDRWVNPGTEAQLSRELGADLRDMVRLCTIAHDIGKASPFFQHKAPQLSRDMPDATLLNPPVPHSTVSGFAVREWLRDHGFSRAASLGVELVVCGHHGSFPSERTYPSSLHLEHGGWQKYRTELMDYLTDAYGVDVDALAHAQWAPHTIAAVCGLVIVCDWLGSNTDLFPTDDVHDYDKRRARALSRLDLGGVWHPHPDPENEWQHRFGLPPETQLNPMQHKVIETAGPGLTIVEHDTGGGKTAAALIAAERIAHQQGRNGIYVALPTRTVANAVFDTVATWLSAGTPDKSPTVMSLIHGKAHTDARFADVAAGQVHGVDYNAWFGKKRGALTPVAVGTIDHVLMCALKSRHVTLRHLGLMSKVLVIDEVHSSDTYMETYLRGLLSWCGALGVPVIALSATLSNARRQLVIDAYRHGQGLGPSEALVTGAESRVTRVDAAGEVRVYPVSPSAAPREVVTTLVGDEPDVSGVVARVRDGGGVVGMVADTVSRAQRWFVEARDAARGTDVRVVLLHSRFTDGDRAVRERELVAQCGRGSLSRPEKLVVVATQVIEQALDIDFDYMVTDVAPVDAFAQRVGRVHRHAGTVRPAQFSRPRVDVCGVSGAVFSPGIDHVYPRYYLLRTLAWLRGRDGESSPFGVPGAMDMVFNAQGRTGCEDIDATLDEALELLKEQGRVESRLAQRCVLPDVRGGLSTVYDWSFASTSVDESLGGVRAPDGSVEVILRRGEDEDLLRVPVWLYSRAWLEGASLRQGKPVVEPVDGVFDLGRGALRYDGELGLVSVDG